MDVGSEPLALAITVIGALLKLLDVQRARTRAAERTADHMRIESAIKQASDASKDVIGARLDASNDDKAMLKQLHEAQIEAERLRTRVAVLEADQGHSAEELARVRKTMVTMDLLNERSDAQDAMLGRIEKRVGGSGLMPRAELKRLEEPPSDPPPMRPRAPSRRFT